MTPASTNAHDELYERLFGGMGKDTTPKPTSGGEPPAHDDLYRELFQSEAEKTPPLPHDEPSPRDDLYKELFGDRPASARVARPFDDAASTMPGAIVRFGCESAAHKRAFRWLIVEKARGKALLLCANAYCEKQFDNQGRSWEQSTVRAWLNSSFLQQHFSEEERELIAWPQSPATQDLVFLPSEEEVKGWLGSETLGTRGKALIAGCPKNWSEFDDSTLRVGMKTDWWLRSPTEGLYASTVTARGVVSARHQSNLTRGVRPAMWVVLPHELR